MDRTDVVTAFLEQNNQILIARRSEDVRTYEGHWAGISGYLEDNDPCEQALTEIREETGLDEARLELTKAGPPLTVDAGDLHWRVHPFRFRVEGDVNPALDREHDEFRWVEPDELKHLKTVPALRDAWEQVS